MNVVCWQWSDAAAADIGWRIGWRDRRGWRWRAGRVFLDSLDRRGVHLCWTWTMLLMMMILIADADAVLECFVGAEMRTISSVSSLHVLQSQ